MALRFNGNLPTGPNPWSAGVGRTIGTASGVNVYTGARALSALGGSRMACHLTYGLIVGLPLGATHPVAWAMPSKSGAIVSRYTINGVGTVTATMQSGQNIDATLTGTGGVTSAIMGLIVSIAAAVSGSGGISSATADALASIAASLTGSGNITATASGLADLIASLTGSGSVNASNTQLMDIAATIVGYGELTPEGLRDAVWNSIASGFNDAGTMGEKLNDAGSASNPWTEVIESGLTAAEILRLIAAAVQGSATGLENGSPVFKSIDGATDRITATYVTGTRTVTARDAT